MTGKMIFHNDTMNVKIKLHPADAGPNDHANRRIRTPEGASPTCRRDL